MSSKSYSTCLTPDPWLRITVLTSGRLLIAAGIILILTLDLDTAIRATGCLVWFIAGWYELAHIERGFESCHAVRLSSDGEIAVLSNDQEWANYESIQADIFDHIFAVIPEFELKVFQAPSGTDISNLNLGA